MWNFSGYYNSAAAGNITYQKTRTTLVRFCNALDVLYFDTYQNERLDDSKWLGYFHGFASSFVATEDGSAPDFIMKFENGDRGRPCTDPRNGTVNIYCRTSPNNPCPSGKCGNDTSFCVCDGSTYTPESIPCNLNLDVAIDCPQPVDISVIPECNCTDCKECEVCQECDDCAGAGQVFGIVFAVFLLFAVIVLIAKTIYNCLVEGKSGLSAIPVVGECMDSSSGKDNASDRLLDY
eukprot:CAMPEP_0201489132 /NCGR_PEP_ID=MMETSP0151_2-20130828/21041_1 /ASSEMBLY_ACC=CAM_ASM_000257 /TAXON_ID=200890 /ORGANISM="Paramoeba atlantica, Strain 621/1 / CCAP 1560/9" /LENGTH=234 /DNA_ID=CAMNT_0047874617 /DNA_START=169 /DNA_END=873 /DNA_ORIENTATION=-